MATEPYRILVTGSRDWDDRDAVREALLTAWYDAGWVDDIVLVSGACRTGADHLAEGIAAGLGWDIERHPARWHDEAGYHRYAGVQRNQEMVDLGADVCIAFIRNESKGATHCSQAAMRSHIPTIVHRDPAEGER